MEISDSREARICALPVASRATGIEIAGQTLEARARMAPASSSTLDKGMKELVFFFALGVDDVSGL